MSSDWGKLIHFSIFGESHGPAIGIVLDGLPAGELIDMDELNVQMSRRAPGKDLTSTPRKEADEPQILSGILNGRTTGAPVCAVIQNTNTRSGDYSNLLQLPRPSHADYPAYIRYQGFNDIRGGGHFSSRLTAPLTFAGAVCRQILKRRGVSVGGHIYSVGECCDTPMDGVNITSEALEALSKKNFAVIAPEAEKNMRAVIEEARMAQDSIGGIVECAAVGLPVGVGSPMFGGVENRLSSLIFGIPAVKGLEFGSGFALAHMRGSQANDPYAMKDGNVRTTANNNGGILGGITTGMPLILRAAIKPTPSISLEQDTVDLTAGENSRLAIHGRHDPCIVPRALPVVESAMAIALLDMMMEVGKC